MFYMICTIVPVFTVDRFGRRFTLFYGAVLQGICLILVAVLTKPDIMAMNPEAFGIGATVFTFGYTGVFGMTWLCVPWLYPVSVTLYLIWRDERRKLALHRDALYHQMCYLPLAEFIDFVHDACITG